MIVSFLTQHAKELRRLLLLWAFIVLAAQFALTASVFADPDYWWHLRTAQWMLEHGTFPTTDPFSQSNAGKTWYAYSWLFELLLYALHQRFGLSAILFYKVPVLLGILWSVLALLRQLQQSFLATLGLSSLVVLVLTQLLTPRPWLLTILFFTWELHLLLHFRQTGHARRLYWLLPLFTVWANVHIQFIYGFIPLALVVTEPVLAEFLRSPFRSRWIRTAGQFRAWLFLPACIAATFVTPYHWRLYRPVLEITQQAGVYQFVIELQSMNFRHPAHWVVLALTIWASYRLGRWQGPKLFPVLFLLAGAILAFRANRDGWVLALAAVTVIAMTRETSNEEHRQGGWRLLAVFLLACPALFLVARQYGLTTESMQKEVEKNYPVAAARVVEERGYPGPLFNHFNWGGYLIWRLPQLPVSMDGRTNLYGEDRIRRSLDVWNGKPGWAQDAELTAAALVITDINQPLCSLLRLDQRFELVYEDTVAAVFRKRP